MILASLRCLIVFAVKRESYSIEWTSNILSSSFETKRFYLRPSIKYLSIFSCYFVYYSCLQFEFLFYINYMQTHRLLFGLTIDFTSEGYKTRFWTTSFNFLYLIAIAINLVEQLNSELCVFLLCFILLDQLTEFRFLER